MKRKNLAKNYKNVLLTGFLFLMSYSHAQQEIIYQQNFDGNNGAFPNTIVSENTPINGWIASSTAPQYGGIYRHLWNFSDRKSTRLNSSHVKISYAVFCLKKKKHKTTPPQT